MPDTRDPTQPDLGVGGVLAGIYDLWRGISGKNIDESRVAAGAADPFAGERGQYQQILSHDINNPANSWMQKLTDLLTNPGSFKTDPGYQFALDQGLEGVARHGNAMFGTTRSGNTAVELDKFGTGFAEQAFDTRVNQLLSNAQLESSNYNQRINQLLTASGANQGSPGEAGRILAGGYANRDASVAGGARGIDQLLRLLGSGGSAASGALQSLQRLLSGGANGALTADDETFLRSIGLDPSGGISGFNIDPFGPDSGVPSDITNILDTTGTGGLEDINPGDLTGVSDSSLNIINDIFGGG